MKIITGTIVLALCCGLALGGLVTGCSVAQKMVTTACGWMDEYIPQAEAQVVKIQADYDTYVAIITGLVPGVGPEVMVAAQAWVAAADIALKTLGAVQKGICTELTDIILAMQTAQESLPKLVIPQNQLMQLKARAMR